MPLQHVIEQGECLASIAAAHGMDWKQIWDAPENADLRSRRDSPHVLFPGDELFIKDKESKEEAGGTEAKHRFRKKGSPVRLRLRFLDEDQPRSGEPYLLLVEGLEFRGQTDGSGALEQKIPACATRGILRLGQPDDVEDYVLAIGALDPLQELSGIQARLNNLGFNCGASDGLAGPATTRALRQFQQKHNLQVSGEPDEATRDKLKQEYGS